MRISDWSSDVCSSDLLYHGWKFGADGTIQETPNHCDPRLRARLKAPAFKVHEEAGLLWAYMGPQDAMPPFRRFAFMEVPDTHRTIFRIYQPENSLQLVQQGTDRKSTCLNSSH